MRDVHGNVPEPEALNLDAGDHVSRFPSVISSQNVSFTYIRPRSTLILFYNSNIGVLRL